jgi:hypothetical protein
VDGAGAAAVEKADELVEARDGRPDVLQPHDAAPFRQSRDHVVELGRLHEAAEVRIVRRPAVSQAAPRLRRPAVKLSMAGTRPKAFKANTVTIAP